MDDMKIGTTNIDKICIGNTLYWQRQAQVAHMELAYLQSSGTQSINTGILGKSGLKVEIKASFLAPSSTAFLFGSRANTYTNCFVLLTMNSHIRTDYGTSSNYEISDTLLTSTNPYVIVKDQNLTYIDGVLKSTLTQATFSNAYPMFLFSANTTGATSTSIKAKIYYCKIWDSNGTLLRDFIPVNKDGVCCMHDKVTMGYFYNQGTGEFIGG